MKDDKEKWIEDVFDSMKGSQRAKPSTELLAKIEQQIGVTESKIIPIYSFRMVAAAAILLLVLNVFAVRQFMESNTVATEELLVEETSGLSLISNYNIYE